MMTSASRVTTSSPASKSMSRYFINKVNFAIESVSNSFVYYYLWCERVVDSLGKKNSSMNNVPSDGRENRLSTAKEARITFRGESSEVKPDQQLWLNQRDVNRTRHDPNKFIGDNRDALPENVSASMSREMGSVCTDERTSVSPQQAGRQLKNDKIECKESDDIVCKIKVSSEKRVSLFVEIYSALTDKNWGALDKLLSNILSSLTDSELINICKNIHSRIFFDDELEYSANKLFLFSVENDQTSLVKILLKIGFNPINEHINDALKPLRHAIDFGSVDIIKLLLTHRADATREEKSSWYILLSRIVSLGYVECAKLLIGYGSDVNGIRRDRGENVWWDWNPLSAAVDKGDVEMVILLLDFGKADPNGGKGRGKCMETPLSIAISKSDVRCVELLLRSGADICDRSLLKSALSNKDIHIAVCLMLKGAKLDAEDATIYDQLLLDSNYDNKKCPLKLLALCFRLLNPFFHVYQPIEKRIAAVGTLEIPHSLEKSFYFGLQKNVDVDGVDLSHVFCQR